MSLGTFLREKRKAIKLPYGKTVSQIDIAREVGVSKSYLCNIELGRAIPGLRISAKLAKAYNVTLAEMAKEITP